MFLKYSFSICLAYLISIWGSIKWTYESMSAVHKNLQICAVAVAVVVAIAATLFVTAAVDTTT